MLTIYTIGHSNHPLDRFLELLAQHGIGELADIRRFPGSRKHPHFNREELQYTLDCSGLVYRWMESLGGRRKASGSAASENLAWRNVSFRNYADYMTTPEFRAAIDILLQDAAERRTAIMCAEGLWWQCHRRLVSDFLTVQGVTVEHIMPNGPTKPHRLTPGTVVVDNRLTYPASKSLFDEE
jgi:uncharacterized protein (DUF488 family)